MPADPSELLVQLQCCHSILNTAWPKPGVPQMAGARSFIGTKLFQALERIVNQITETVQSLTESQVKDQLSQAWTAVAKLVVFLKVSGRDLDTETIDRAFNLLYLTSGVAYHRLAAGLSQTPPQNERFSTVENLADLLGVSAWPPSEPSPNPADLLEAVAEEISKVISRN